LKKLKILKSHAKKRGKVVNKVHKPKKAHIPKAGAKPMLLQDCDRRIFQAHKKYIKQIQDYAVSVLNINWYV
jgi:hypothetical protein